MMNHNQRKRKKLKRLSLTLLLWKKLLIILLLLKESQVRSLLWFRKKDLRLTKQIHLIMSLMMNNGHLFSFTIPSMPLVHMRWWAGYSLKPKLKRILTSSKNYCTGSQKEEHASQGKKILVILKKKLGLKQEQLELEINRKIKRITNK